MDVTFAAYNNRNWAQSGRCEPQKVCYVGCTGLMLLNPRQLNQLNPLTHPRKMPRKKLADGVDLVIVTTVWKARDLGPKILKPRRPLGQPYMTSFDAGGLRMEPRDLVIPWQERGWIGDAMMLGAQLLDEGCA